MEYAAAAFHDKVYVARLEHSSKTASEIRADAASTPGTVEHAARTEDGAHGGLHERARDNDAAAAREGRRPHAAHTSRE